MARFTEEQFKAIEGAAWRQSSAALKVQHSVIAREALSKPRHKFNAKKVEYDGIKFDSILEGDFYLHLKLQQRAGIVLFFLRQVPIHLPGGTKLVVDFQVFYTDGSCRFFDTKGVETPEFLIKKREIEHHYPFEIEVIKRGDF
ncbi:DUF1064 domain-containing protein [uncultured Thiothrix sp.]|uniref:DUF1064 domain-containing protein n=1 Tax=uncultured Thiothrix sp. TaxID=223185 RepID=UPI002603D729|nr:DUF1064 domain-containing protein [uncultured Thiothrix sp.]